jgi:hypothetical protein
MSSTRPVRARGAWTVLALVLVVSVVQGGFNSPAGSSTATPDSVATCNSLFPHSEQASNLLAARLVEAFRSRCERGLPLKK